MNIKHIILFLISFIYLFALPVSAQEKIMEGEVTINNRVYSVSKRSSKYGLTRILIQENNAFIQKQMNNPKCYASIGNLDFATKETLISSFIKVLGTPRVMELSAYAPIRKIVYPDHTGKIKAIEFYITSDLPITMNELDNITDYIKKNVSFKIPEHIGPDQQIPPIHQTLPIDVILKRGR